MFRVGIYHSVMSTPPGKDARRGGYHEAITLKRAARGKKRMFSNLIAARAQMGTSLVFHVIFSVLGVGLPLLPSLWFLFHVFKFQQAVPPVHEKEVKEA